MCGSYIHGRSWIEEVAWKHFCKPYEVNSHQEMPMPASRDKMQVPREVAKMISDAYRQKESVRDFPFLRFTMRGKSQPATVYPIQYDPNDPLAEPFTLDEYRIDLREVKGIESRHAPASPEGREFFLVRDMKPTHLIDWGLRPWDGTIAIQRADRDSILSINDTLKIESFLPKTRADLTKWAKAHWGKRGDGNEFLAEMPRCLDYEKLKPSLPKIDEKRINATAKCVLKQIASAVKVSGAIIGTAGSVTFEGESLARGYHLQMSIRGADSPVDRFCEMFAEAPNAFWAERN